MDAETFEQFARTGVRIAGRVERLEFALDASFEHAQRQRANPVRVCRAALFGDLTGRFQIAIVSEDRFPERVDTLARNGLGRDDPFSNGRAISRPAR